MATTAPIAVRTEPRTAPGSLALWHLLSLDAPTVAALWAAFAASALGVPLPWTAPAALAVAVWILYVADRLGDAHKPTSALEERHHFHAENARAFLFGVSFAAPLLLTLLFWIPSGVRNAWVLLGLPLLAYVAAVHALQKRVPKEVTVGIFFAIAVFTPCLMHSGLVSVLAPAALFAVLCWLNCCLIARCEHAPERAMDPATRMAVRHFQACSAVLAMVALLLACVLHEDRMLLSAIATAAALLHGMDRTGDRFTRLQARCLADAALLTPLIAWPLLHLPR